MLTITLQEYFTSLPEYLRNITTLLVEQWHMITMDLESEKPVHLKMKVT